jgi:hypothetical protein
MLIVLNCSLYKYMYICMGDKMCKWPDYNSFGIVAVTSTLRVPGTSPVKLQIFHTPVTFGAQCGAVSA